MRRRLMLAISLLVVSVPSQLRAAGSGSLWFRPWSTPNVLMRFQTQTAGPQTISVESSALGGELGLLVFDSCDQQLASLHFSFAGAGEQSISVPLPAAGEYSLKIIGQQQYQGRIRIHTTATHFVIPGIADFDAPFELHSLQHGTYYFYVPADTAQFRFRLWVPDHGETATALLRGPDGSVRLNQTVSGADSTWSVPVDPADRGAFWRVDLSHIGDVRFAVIDVPNWFAETPSAWFEPSLQCAPATAAAVPAMSVEASALLFVALTLVGLAILRTSSR